MSFLTNLNSIPAAVVTAKTTTYNPVHPTELDPEVGQLSDSDLVAKVIGRHQAIAALPAGSKATKAQLGWEDIPVEASDDEIRDFCNRLCEAMIANRKNIISARIEAVGQQPCLQFTSGEKTAEQGYCNQHGASNMSDALLAFQAMQLLGLGSNVRPILFTNACGRYEFRERLTAKKAPAKTTK